MQNNKSNVRQRAQVGARSLLAIEADPQATAEEVRRLPKKRAIAHPNCPKELWWELAAQHPMEAQASILYELMTLELPGQWEELERKHIEKWITRGMGQLTITARHLFSADCAAHVLPFFEKEFPDDDRPREAIKERRRYARGQGADEAQWLNAAKAAAAAGRHAARMASNRSPAPYSVRRARYQARSAANAAAGPAVGSSLDYAPNAAALVFGGGQSSIPERRWQWHRLQEYLRSDWPSAIQPWGDTGAVGARDREEVMDDPMATQEEIKSLRRKDPLAALHHPNCPEELWWQLAGKYPLEAHESLMWGLNQLANPERWREIEKKKVGEWIRSYSQKLSHPAQRLFVADCAEHVLPLFARKHPNDPRPRHAIEAVRNFARGVGTGIEMNAASEAAIQCGKEIKAASAAYWATAAAAAAAYLNVESAAWDAPGYAAHAYQVAKLGHSPTGLERQWQWTRLQEYLRGEVPSSAPQQAALSSRPRRKP